MLFEFKLPESSKFLLLIFFSLRLFIVFILKLNSFGLKLDNLKLNLFFGYFFAVLFVSLSFFSFDFTNKVKCKGKSITFLELTLSLFFIKEKNSFLIVFFLLKFGDNLSVNVFFLLIFHESFSMKNYLFIK